jgi:ACS family tartrate transporter-like MFS transporter
MVIWGRISDRMNERRWNLLAACVCSTVGLVLAGMTMGTWWALLGMSIAAIGFYGSKGPFFAMPPMFLAVRDRGPCRDPDVTAYRIISLVSR